MKTYKLISPLLISIILFGCGQNNEANVRMSKVSSVTANYKLSFIELGSVRCIPCRQMQTVMRAIEQEYNNQVKVVFHDVATKEGKPYADQYKINTIPVQIVLDEHGKEIYRHEGYLSKEEVSMVFNKNGVSKLLK
jgi:thioredoxin 1